MPPATVTNLPGPVVNIPSIDLVSWLQNIYSWLISIYPYIIASAKSIVGLIIGLSFPLSFFFLVGIIYCVERLKTIRKREAEIYDAKVVPAYDVAQNGDPALSQRWQSVVRHIESESQNDWKQAILEADIILDEILDKMGYRGESIGDKLKKVEASDFITLNEAWEAHKVRNQIAHDGSTFVLGQVEAKRVVNLYKKVFEEFYYI